MPRVQNKERILKVARGKGQVSPMPAYQNINRLLSRNPKAKKS
jgi:hypothetical protein